MKAIKLPPFEPSPPPPATYANAEVRGQLRLWKKDLMVKYNAFERVYYQGSTIRPQVEDFVNRSSEKGRRRAFPRVEKAFGPGVKREWVDFSGRHPLALWTILCPRMSVAANGDPGRMQDCVTMNYIVVGLLPNFDGIGERYMSEGLWTLEIPDHALGRAIERSGGKLPDAIIREAHLVLLHLPEDRVPLDGETRFYLKAGAGCFVCHACTGRDVRNPHFANFHIRADTWLDNDLLHDNQIPLCEVGKTGERMMDGYLRPRPFNEITETDDGYILKPLPRK